MTTEAPTQACCTLRKFLTIIGEEVIMSRVRAMCEKGHSREEIMQAIHERLLPEFQVWCLIGRQIFCPVNVH
jgi:hypothetical protein